MDAVRLDKWLWAARFFKTRTLAAKACELGRVTVNGIQAKPAREIHTGMKLRIRREGDEYEITVLGLSDQRGPASVAQTLYVEPEESRAAREKAREERRLAGPLEFLGEGRPSKRDRRELDRLKGGSW